MKDEIREQVSAWLDDELNELERPLLLSRLQRDEPLRESVDRYQLIGEVMRGAGQAESLGVAERVQAALADESEFHIDEAPIEPSYKAAPEGWGKKFAGFAVAASVAIVALYATTSVRTVDNETVPPVAVNAASVPAAEITVVSDGQWDRIDPAIDKRLTGYLVNHSEYSASHGVQGVNPYARIVGFQND